MVNTLLTLQCIRQRVREQLSTQTYMLESAKERKNSETVALHEQRIDELEGEIDALSDAILLIEEIKEVSA